jgi:hypothetical protein
MSRWILLLIITAGLSACAPKNQSTDASAAVGGRVIVNIDNLRMRNRAGGKGDIVATLPQGAILEQTGARSKFNSKISLRGIEYDEPWLEVRTAGGQRGWVFAGAVNFDLSNPSALALELTHQRLEYLFGHDLATSIEHFRNQYLAVRRSRELADFYRKGTTLRDTLVRSLSAKLQFNDLQTAPDLFWLKDVMPCIIPQLAAEGTAYYLFWDYRLLSQKAQETEGDEDNEFTELCLLQYPADSIEYFFPAWTIQTWDYGGHSLLGRGIHLQLLSEMDEILETNDLFEPEILKIKARLLDDIRSEETTFWESKEKILPELDAILSSELGLLSLSEKEALQARRRLFANAEEHGIQTDFRSGKVEF